MLKSFRKYDSYMDNEFEVIECLACHERVPHSWGARFCMMCGCEWEAGLVCRPRGFPRWAWNRGICDWDKLPPRDTTRLTGYRLHGTLWHRETGEPWGSGWKDTTWNDDLHVTREAGLVEMKRLWSAFQWRLGDLKDSAEFLMDNYELRVRLVETPSNRILWEKTYR